MKNLVLIGFMGTGKSAVGRRVARRLGCPFIDVDACIEAREGRTITELFRTRGEPHFREVESTVIAEASVQHGAVIATGGGAVLRPQNVERLKTHGVLVCLHADPATIARRVSRRKTRPLLAGEDGLTQRIEHLLETRATAYAAAADVTINTDGRSVDEVAADVLRYAKRLMR